MVWLRFLARLHRRPSPRTEALGPAIQRAEHEVARQRLLDLARRRRAAHLYDGPTFGRLP